MNERDLLEGLKTEVRVWLDQGRRLEQRLNELEAHVRAHADVPVAQAQEAPRMATRAVPPPLPPQALPKEEAPFAPLPSPTPDLPAAAAPAGPGMGERIGGWLRALGPKEEMSWEMALGSYWLPRAAVVVLGIGVVWLMGFAINRMAHAWWMPYARIALGYILCAGLLGLGRWQEAKRPGFARVVMGAGIGLSYFVTFATHFIPYSRVIARPEPVLLMLALLVVAWCGVAQARGSRLLALAVVALGHLTVLISTVTLAHPSQWAEVGLVALSLASGFFLARNRWYAVGAAGMLGSYANHFFWMARSPGSDRPIDFAVAMAVLVLYGLIFALSELFAPEDLRRRGMKMYLRTGFVAFNSAAVLVLGAALMYGFSFTRPYPHVFYFAFAPCMLALGYAYRWKRDSAETNAFADPLFNAYFVKAAMAFSFGLATWLGGHSLAMALAVEGLALLAAARYSQLIVTRVLALAAFALAFAQGLRTSLALGHLAIGFHHEFYLALAVPAFFTVFAFLGGAVLWRHTAWAAPDLRGTRWPEDWRRLLWWLELNSGAPRDDSKRDYERPERGMPVPYLLAIAAGFLGICEGVLLQVPHETGAVLGIAALLAVIGAFALDTAALAFTAAVWCGVSGIALVAMAYANPQLNWFLPGAAALLAAALYSDAKLIGPRGSLWPQQSGFGGYWHYGMAALALGSWLDARVAHPYTGLAMAAAGIPFAVAMLRLNERALGACAAGLGAFGCLSWWTGNAMPDVPAWHLTALATAGLAFGFDRWLDLRKTFARRVPGAILVTCAWPLLLYYAMRAPQDKFACYAWLIVALGYGAYGAWVNGRTPLAISALTATGSTVIVVMSSYATHAADGKLLLNYGFVILYWFLAERGMAWVRDVRYRPAREYAAAAFALAASLMLAVLLERLPFTGGSRLSISWTLAALAMFATGIATAQPYYRYAGFATFVCVLYRLVVIDSRGLETPWRIAGMIFLGLVLLGVGYGYLRWQEQQKKIVSADEADGRR